MKDNNFKLDPTFDVESWGKKYRNLPFEEISPKVEALKERCRELKKEIVSLETKVQKYRVAAIASIAITFIAFIASVVTQNVPFMAASITTHLTCLTGGLILYAMNHRKEEVEQELNILHTKIQYLVTHQMPGKLEPMKL